MEPTPPWPPQFDGAAIVLFDAMSAISEAAYGVRWAPGTEYRVWMLLTEPRVRWGRVRGHHADVDPALTLIGVLVQQAGIWIIWPPGEYAPHVMTLDDWRVRYATTAGRRIA